MEELINNRITININEKAYLKDPNSSELGQKILRGSIDLMDELGVEDFTFKKLAIRIGSTEASVYRYFESKHHLLLFLVMWYWGWQEYRLVLRLINIEDSMERLKRSVQVLTEEIVEDSTFSQINEVKLHRIVNVESTKLFLTKKVEEDNSSGFFSTYKDIVERVASIILDINPSFKYPHMLISTVIEGAHHQRYFAEHLPRLTDIVEGEDAITTFYQQLVFKTIQN